MRILAVISLCSFTACDSKKDAPAEKKTDTKGGISSAELYKEFSGDRAYDYTKRQVDCGPRSSGSPNLEKARVLIEETLKKHGWDVERQSITTAPVPGRPEIEYINIIGRFTSKDKKPAPDTTQRIILCSHYDTKFYTGVNSFVGANDAASSTGALLEAARVLALAPKAAEQVEIVFFDGEEALQTYTQTDGLVGSRHYSSILKETSRAQQFSFAILWDMIGDNDLTITLPPDSNKEITEKILASAETLGLRKYFSHIETPILDDHKMLENIALIPAVVLIDFDYLYWHTGGDTMDKVSPESLKIVPQVTLHMLGQLWSQPPPEKKDTLEQ